MVSFIESRLRDLVHQDAYGRQFSLKYQPIVHQTDDGTAKIIGMEALLRWNSPEIGAVSPETFIPIAESCNLIVPIGEWVFLQAIQDFKILQQQTDQPLFISVNLSARQLNRANFARQVNRIVRRAAVDPRQIQLELTETVCLEYHQDVLQNIGILRSLGIRLAIDDFGSGHASMAYLEHFPAKTLKLDKSYVQGMDKIPENRDFIDNTLELAKNLHKDIIIEGVETAEQLQTLFNSTCDKFQGYYFSRPVSLLQLAALLRQRKWSS